jgi:hypothetical protein
MTLDSTTWELIKAFREERLTKIDSGEIPVSLAEGSSTVIHLLPASAFDPGASVDLSAALAHRPLEGLTGQSWGLSYDFEGVLVWETAGEEETTSYVQLFRTGCVEIADRALLASGAEGGKPDIRTFERAVYTAARNWIGLLQKVGARGPLAVALTLTEVRDWSLEGGDAGDERLTPRPIDRDDLVIPEALLEDLGADPAKTMRTVFDPLWNAGGYPGSKSFNSEGAWRG